MKYTSIESVEPGQFLGKTIFSANGSVLLAENVQLTAFMINTLRRIGVTMLYIKDPNFSDVEIVDIISDETKRVVMKQMVETFETVRSGKDFNTKKVSVSIDVLLDEIMRNKEVLLQLTDIRTEDNAMYVHALNVAMMAILMGINLGLPQTQLKDLAIGALLHDIGKVGSEPDAQINNVRMHHTWRGFEILKLKRELSLLIAHVAFQHHETINGQGVPRGLEAEQIHLFAKITAIANVYDNLLCDPVNGKRLLPHEACELLTAEAGITLDRDILIHFLKTISIYPTGTSVKLSTLEVGVVVGQHRGLPGRPIVRIVKEDGERELIIKEVDLAQHHTVFILSVIS